MRAVIDTNIIIDFFNGIEPAKEELSQYHSPVISVISWIEIMVGVKDETEFRQIDHFMQRFTIEGIGEVVSLEAVKIRRATKKKLPDAIIEATAKANETILVTRNTKDFDRTLPHIRIPYSLN